MAKAYAASRGTFLSLDRTRPSTRVSGLNRMASARVASTTKCELIAVTSSDGFIPALSAFAAKTRNDAPITETVIPGGVYIYGDDKAVGKVRPTNDEEHGHG